MKMMMMNWMVRLILCLALVVMAGCASVQEGHDPVVVRAEQSLSIAFDTVDTFLKIEHGNREVIKAKVPEVHAFAEKLRERVTVGGKTQPYAISLIQSATEVKNAYKRNRSLENRANLISALASLEALVRETQQHLTAIK
jgi:predicted metal-dependent hydrolase